MHTKNILAVEYYINKKMLRVQVIWYKYADSLVRMNPTSSKIWNFQFLPEKVEDLMGHWLMGAPPPLVDTEMAITGIKHKNISIRNYTLEIIPLEVP